MKRTVRDANERSGEHRIRASLDDRFGLARRLVSEPPPTIPEAGFVRIRQVLAVYPIGRSTWWAGVKSGRFPRPVKLGPRTTAWRVEEIRGLLTQPRV
jgi:predicted DNA-binding transcriptional regulator AlpA